jgi:nucleoside-diphosphate-sugar epimerase
VIDESSPIANGHGLEPPYPRHKVEVEKLLMSYLQSNPPMKLTIFRPGILIDEERGPARMLSLGKKTVALGFGNGRNCLPYISARDVANAIVSWLESGKESSVYNITPSRVASSREWYRRWGTFHGKNPRPFFVRPFVVLGAGLGITLLKRVMGKKGSMLGFRYAMASATRNLRYSNERLKKDLGWEDRDTLKYFEMNR